MQWVEINNVLDFKLKTNLKRALENLEKQLKALDKDEENCIWNIRADIIFLLWVRLFVIF